MEIIFIRKMVKCMHGMHTTLVLLISINNNNLKVFITENAHADIKWAVCHLRNVNPYSSRCAAFGKVRNKNMEDKHMLSI